MKPSEKSLEMITFLNKFTGNTFGRTRSESISKSICVTCGKPVTDFKDDLSSREYCISGMCQDCQDKTFGTGDEE
jgi:hypothetical protein